MTTPQRGRWAGRDENKDEVRASVWSALDEGGMAMGPTWSHIPNFIGADMAAWRLAQEWPAADLQVIHDAGHSSLEPGIVDALVRAGERFLTGVRW